MTKKSNKKSTTPKFVAKGFDYEHAISKEVVEVKDNALDYESLSLDGLFSNLKSHLAKKSSMFLFLRSRENRKVELEIEHQEALTRSIEAFTQTHEVNLKLKASQLFSVRAIELLILNKENEYKLLIEQNATLIQKQKTERKLSKLSVKEKKQTLELTRLMEMAKIDLLNAQTKGEKQNAEIMKAFIAHLQSLPPAYVADMFSEFINKHKESHPNERTDPGMKEFLQEYSKEKYNEDLAQTKAETVGMNSKANFEKWKNERKMEI